jgi:hypothetical protein
MESITVKHLLNEHRAEIEKQLGYLVNVAKRLKLTAPTWEFSEVYEHEFSILLGSSGYGEDRDEEYENYIEKCFDVTLHIADTLKIDGNWIFSCVIDHRAKAMTQINETVEIPMRYSPSNDCCEHCGKKYPRVKSYIVHNQNNNEFKQVGKGCLKQFLGINPASYITMFEAVSKFSPFVIGLGYSKNRGGRLDNLAYSVSEMLNYTVHQVSKDKGVFVKPEWKKIQSGFDWRGEEQYKNVRVNEGEATLDKVKIRLDAISFFRMNPNLRNDATTIEELEERIKFYSMRLGLFDGINKVEQRASARIGEIRYSINEAKRHIHAIKYKNLLDENVLNYPNKLEAIKTFTNSFEIEQSEEITLSSFDEYRLLLKNIFAKERTLQANLKTIVSGYGFYLSQIERAKQDAIRKANAEHLLHVGKEGEKSELILKIISYKEGEGAYGTWKLWGM